jgi:outer membrane protein assembly factor BamB
LKWRSKALNGTISAMPIIDSDSSELVNNEVISKIFVTTNNGTVYDFSGTSTLPYQEQPLPMVMINPQHQGVSRYRGPLSTSTSIRNVWQQPAPFVSSNLYVLPSISIKSIESNNLLYLASNDGKLYTIADTYNNPSILNILSLSSLEIYTTPLIGYDGTIYVGSRDGYLYAVNPFPLFTKKWQYYVGGFLQSSPIMDASGIIYFASGTNMYAIGDGGAYGAYLKWLNPYSTGGNIKSSPALGMNGYLYFGSDDGYIYAIDSVTGLEQYKIKPSNTPTLPARSGDTDPFPGDPGYPAADIHPVYTSATVDISNNVIIGNGSWMQGILYYLDGSDLSTKWSCSFDNETGPFYNTVAVKGDVIYLSTIAYVYAINRVNGSLNWTYNGNFIYYSSPMVDASGYIYVSAIINDNIETTEAASIISLKDMGTSYVENWVLKVSDGPLMKGRLAPPVIGPNNRIYVSSTDNRIYAIGDPLYIV